MAPNQLGELTDDEVFGGGIPQSPMASRELSDDEVFGAPPLSKGALPNGMLPGGQGTLDPERPTLGQRFWANANEAFRGSTIYGGLTNLFDRAHEDAVVRNLKRFGYDANVPEAKRKMENSGQAGHRAFEAMPSFTTAPSFIDSAVEGLASLGGQLAGGMASPESFATLSAKSAAVVERAIAPVIKNEIGRKVVQRGTEQAVINTATDPVVQGVNIAAGARASYDPVQTALAGPLGFLVGATIESPGAALGLAKAFRAWRAKNVATVTPETVPTPEEVDAFTGSPELLNFMQANGITDRSDPRVTQLEGRLATRREAEAQRQAPQDAGGSRIGTFKRDLQKQVQEREVAAQAQPVEATGGATVDTLHPAALATEGRVSQPVPDIISVDSGGRADIGDAGLRAGVLNAENVASGVRQNADEAFRLAELQRTRAGSNVRDTQPASRAQGVNPVTVALDEGFPVQIQERKISKVNGREIEVATVQRYDPRTNKVDPDSVPYDVPVNQLKTSNYAKEPRLAQDFVQRSSGVQPPEQPRMANEPITLDPRQTYRTTQPHPNEEFPGAGSSPREVNPEAPSGGGQGNAEHLGRSPLPKSPTEPPPNKGPFRTRSTNEEEVVQEFMRRQREAEARKAEEEARKARGEATSPGSSSSKARPTDSQTSTQAKAPGTDKRYEVDDRGFVASDKGGPVKFADHKQAAKWIINVGHKTSPDQIFEIENHPSGKGFTVHERGRAEAPTTGGDGAATAPPNEASSGVGATERPAADGASPSPPDEEATTNFRNKFYANPLGDPEVWKELRNMLKSTAGWVGREADAWSHNFAHMMHAFQNSRGSVKDAINHFFDRVRVFTDTNDGVLRTLAGRYKSDTIKGIADMLHAPADAGRGGAVTETYHEAVERNYSTWMNRVSALLKPFDKMTPEELDQTLAQIGQLVTRPGSIKPGTPTHDAARGFAKIFREALDYMRAAGVEVGEVKNGYLPRIDDHEKVMANPAGFQAAAKRAFMVDGASVKEATEAAEDWFQRILLGDLGVRTTETDFLNIGGSTGQPNFTRGRVLSKRADEILEDFYLRNPADIMPRYLMRATRRAEWSRRFGAKLEKWAEMKKKIVAEGGGEAMPDIVQAIKSATNNFGQSSGGASRTLGFIRTWAVLRFLPRAVYSSLSEPATIGIRSGNALDMLRGYGRSLQQWIPFLRKIGDGQRLRDLAEDLGFVGDAVDQLVMMQRTHGVSEVKVAKLIQSKFFRITGLTQFTEANRIAAMAVGGRFIRRLAHDVLDKTSHETMARSLLAEMGVIDTKTNDFASWVRDLDGKPNVSDILEGGEHGKAYQLALRRFISQTVMAPTGSTRPRYANHPTGSLFYNLMSFTYAFQKNVLNRALSMGAAAFKPSSDLNLSERLSYLAPLGLMPVLVAINYGVGEARDALLTDPARVGQRPKTGWDKFLTAVSRSGVDGIMDMPLNTILGLRYQRDPANVLAGPVWGAASDFLGAGVALAGKDNSANTNTAERKFQRAIYDNVIQPILEAAWTAAVPVRTGGGLAAGFAGITGAYHPGTRETFVGAVAGPPEPARGGGGRAGRGTGR